MGARGLSIAESKSPEDRTDIRRAIASWQPHRSACHRPSLAGIDGHRTTVGRQPPLPFHLS